jgi:hypothetical protein
MTIKQLRDYFNTSNEKNLDIIISCKNDYKQVANDLKSQGIAISVSDSKIFGIINARISGYDLDRIEKIKGIANIELDTEARALD